MELLKTLPENSIDSCVVDPPYGLEFMGHEWDTFGAGVEKDAKSAGGYGADSPTNENAYGAARVRYGAMNKQLWTERPAKVEARANGRNRATDSALPVYTGGMAYQKWNEAWAREVFRVLKPGGFLLAFGGPRTYHRMACGVEDAGFEIRDMMDWFYLSGFPKTYNAQRAIDMHLCKQTGRHYPNRLPKKAKRRDGDHVCKATQEGAAWEDYGTALKPGHEPICMARKPFKTSLARNLLQWGTGVLNIGACRIGREADDVPGWHKSGANGSKGYQGTDTFKIRNMSPEEIQKRCGDKGRYPANVMMDEEAGELLEVKGGASRFFYCPKPSKREKDTGLDAFEEKAWVQWQTANGTSGKANAWSEERSTTRRNTHPTIKPLALMRYLVRLVTPVGGAVLDHLCGSGTTGVAAIEEGFKCILIDQNPEYWELTVARCKHAEEQLNPAPAHTCHAQGCSMEVPPRMFMCHAHWYMVPRDIQRAIWKHYVPGQEITKTPTKEYLNVARFAIAAVIAAEEKRRAANDSPPQRPKIHKKRAGAASVRG